MSVFENIHQSEIEQVLLTYSPCWEKIELAAVVYREQGQYVPLAVQIRAIEEKTKKSQVYGPPAIPDNLRMFTLTMTPTSGIKLLTRLLNGQRIRRLGMTLTFEGFTFQRAAFLGSMYQSRLYPEELDRFMDGRPALFFEGSLGPGPKIEAKYQALYEDFSTQNYDFPLLNDAAYRLIGVRTGSGQFMGAVSAALKIPVSQDATAKGPTIQCRVHISHAISHLPLDLRCLVRSESGERFVRFPTPSLRTDGIEVLLESSLRLESGDEATEVVLRLDQKRIDSVQIKKEQNAPMAYSTDGKKTRRRILRFILERERQPSSGIPELPEISSHLATEQEEVSDQIDILEKLGVLRANRTFGGGAAPVLTGRGKLLLEEWDQEAGPMVRQPEREGVAGTSEQGDKFEWDVFISHASEDKDTFVSQLAQELESNGIRTWYDESTLVVGDSLRRSIDFGLARSKYGIVVLSHHFFAKEWPQRELGGLVTRERNGEKVILPVWLDVGLDDVAKYSPTLADRVAARASLGMGKVVSELLQAIQRP